MNGYTRHGRAAACYREALQTQAPARQIAQLYDCAILRLKEAKAAIRDGRIEDRFHAVMKAFTILQGLQSCLDHERGGSVAAMLDRFYAHALGRMLHINQRNDPAICDELVAFLAPMRESWTRIADGPTPAGHGPGSLPPSRGAPASMVT